MRFLVNNNLWNLKFVGSGNKDLQRSDGTYTFGVTDNSVKTVYIMRGMSAEMTERVLCHELCHVICFEHEISLPITEEEWLCNFMADYGKEIIYLLDDLLGNIERKVI